MEVDASRCRLGFEVARARSVEGREEVSEMAHRSEPGVIAAVNGDFFTPEDRPIGLEVSGGSVRGVPTRPVFAWRPGRTPMGRSGRVPRGHTSSRPLDGPRRQPRQRRPSGVRVPRASRRRPHRRRFGDGRAAGFFRRAASAHGCRLRSGANASLARGCRGSSGGHCRRDDAPGVRRALSVARRGGCDQPGRGRVISHGDPWRSREPFVRSVGRAPRGERTDLRSDEGYCVRRM